MMKMDCQLVGDIAYLATRQLVMDDVGRINGGLEGEVAEIITTLRNKKVRRYLKTVRLLLVE